VLKLSYDGPLSKFAFKFNLRRYIKEFQRKLLDWMSVRGRGLVALRKLFKFLDADNSGEVSADEFAKGMLRMNIDPRLADRRQGLTLVQLEQLQDTFMS
jgi:Ca2+-binding EF-hand superfamily protein